MSGGLIQLVAYGAQDVYLTGNPQITYFKIVYRRYTNFAIESIEQPFVGDVNFGKTLTTVLSKNADLISKVYVKIILNPVESQLSNNFAWVRRLGHALLQQIEVDIGGTTIDRQYGTWLDIWYELARNGDQDRGYANMIGDVSELTNYDNSTKPQYTLFIPLQFWCNRYIGLAIPLIALQYTDLRFYVTLAAKETVIVKDINFDDTGVTIQDATLLINVVYLDTEERRRFAQVGHEYLIEQVQYSGIEQVITLVNTYQLNYNHPTKEIVWAMKNGNYTTQQRFVYYTNSDKWYEKNVNTGITPIDSAAEKILLESISVNFDPTAIAGGIWVELLGGNLFGTYNNINVRNASSVPVYINANSLASGAYGITSQISADVVINTDQSITVLDISSTLSVRDFSIPWSLLVDTRYNPVDPLVNQFSNYGVLIDGTINPVQTGLIQFNGHDRFDVQDGAYFNYVQPDAYHSNTPKDGINVYSFALYPEQHQPSGTANLSRIEKSTLTIAFNDPTQTSTNPSNQLYIYGTNYNILRIMSGLAGLAYTTV